MRSLRYMTSDVFTKKSHLFRALANAKRLEILSLLRKKELSVNEITDSLKFRQSNISQHLNVLKNAGIVESRRIGKKIYYRLLIQTLIDIPDMINREL